MTNYRDPRPISPVVIDYDRNKVDPRVKSYAKQTREKTYGGATREAMARGIEVASVVSTESKDLSEETSFRQTVLTKQFDDQIHNMTLEDPSSAEMVAARTSRTTGKSYDTTGTRLDEIDNQVEDKISQITSNETWTVGEAADFPTINAAIEFMSKRYPNYTKDGYEVEVKLKSGFVVKEQLLVRGIDLGYITLTSEDEWTVVDRDSIDQILSDHRKPVFGGIDNAILPILKAKFRLSDGIETNVDGVAVFSSSYCFIHSTSAFVGFYNNISAYYSGNVSMYREGLSIEEADSEPTLLNNAIENNIHCTYNSTIGVPYANLDNAGNHGVLAIWGSSVDMYRATARNCKKYGVYSRDDSDVNARETDVSGCDIGYYALHRGNINARYKKETSGEGASRCRIGVFAQHKSDIDAEGMVAESCTEFGLRASHTGTIEARLANVSKSKVGMQAEYSSTINGHEATATDCEVALDAHDTSQISASQSDLSRAKRNAAYARKCGTINMDNAIATDCGSVAVLAREASTINAEGVDAQRAKQVGANAAQMSIINARNGKFRKNPAQDTSGETADLIVYDGGQICAFKATGGTNVTKNSITVDGIIFG